MKVEIKSQDVQAVERTSPSTGKPYVVRTQKALLRGTEEVKKFAVRLEDGQQPFEPGLYEISSESLTVNAYGQLQLGRVLLEKAGK